MAPGCLTSQLIARPERSGLEIVWMQAGVLGDAGQHPRTNLFVVVKREREVLPTVARKGAV